MNHTLHYSFYHTICVESIQDDTLQVNDIHQQFSNISLTSRHSSTHHGNPQHSSSTEMTYGRKKQYNNNAVHHLKYYFYYYAAKHRFCPKCTLNNRVCPDNSLTFGQVPGISSTTIKFPDILRFSAKVIIISPCVSLIFIEIHLTSQSLHHAHCSNVHCSARPC